MRCVCVTRGGGGRGGRGKGEGGGEEAAVCGGVVRWCGEVVVLVLVRVVRVVHGVRGCVFLFVCSSRSLSTEFAEKTGLALH